MMHRMLHFKCTVLSDNQLTGSLPAQISALGSLIELWDSSTTAYCTTFLMVYHIPSPLLRLMLECMWMRNRVNFVSQSCLGSSFCFSLNQIGKKCVLKLSTFGFQPKLLEWSLSGQMAAPFGRQATPATGSTTSSSTCTSVVEDPSMPSWKHSHQTSTLLRENLPLGFLLTCAPWYKNKFNCESQLME